MPTGEEKRVKALGPSFRLRAYPDLSWDGFSVFIDTRRDVEDGTKTIVEAIAVRTVSPDAEPTIYREPLMRITPENAQRLMDDLWQAGLRPFGEGNAGQVTAMKTHLNDMRAIVFDRLKMDRPVLVDE